MSFWRDSSPDRTLHRTRPLCQAEKLDAMTEKQRDEEIARISRWAEENRDE